ncbi:ABC transporter substrate-binding protein [Luedemannella flava]|uniref:ABC transporter substrate-binding protein n=1 Tax=Luedemannella flava TaxID=349316 RepID=A0ABP4XRC3_9ACTN
MQVRRRAAWAVPASLIVVTSALAGCGGDDEGGGSANTSAVVTIGIAEPQFLIPTNTNETSGSQVLAALYTPLVDYDAQNKPYEVAAESITPSNGNKTWTIKLKDGYTFHNGEKVTSDSFIDSWNYGAYGPNGQNNNYFFDKIAGYADMNTSDPDGDGPKTAPVPKAKTLSGLKKVDDLTYTVDLTNPFIDFKTLLGYTAFYPLPKAAFESDGSVKKDFENAPVGNGPFKMKGTWQHDQQIEVERYDAYPGTKPKVAGAIFKVYLQPTAEYNDLLAGNVDVMKQIPTENLTTAPNDLGDRFLKSPASSLQILAFPTYDPKFAKVEVRKAISMAIDRDEQVTAIFKGSQTSARSFVSPVVAGYRPDTCGDACKYNPTAAKEAYTAAAGPSSLVITYNADGGHKDWVEATCNQLKNNLGVTCTAQPEAKFADLLTKLDKKQNVGMFRMGWVMDYPSMENYLGPLYTTNGSSNYYGFSNKEFDDLVAAGQQAETAEAAIVKYQAAEDILAKEMPVMPMRFGQNVFGHSERTRNVAMDLFNRVDLLQIEVVS